MNLKKILLFLICYFIFFRQILASEKMLVVGICGQKPDIDSILSCRTEAEKIIAGTVFNSLLKHSPGSPNSVEPELAESIPKPRVSGGKQYWTFTIKKNVMFHRLSGRQDYELDADDVAYSLELLAGSDDSILLSGIETRIESKNKITLILEKPLSPNLFLPKLTGYNGFYIFSRKTFEGEALFSGTGPFMFVSGAEKDGLYLRANKSYFKGEPNIDDVRFIFSSDTSKMEQSLLRGDLDILIPSKDFTSTVNIKSSGNLKYLYFYNGHFIYLDFNLKAKPFNDMRLRKLIAENINRDALCTGINGCERLYGLAPQITSGSLTRDEIVKLGLDYRYRDGSPKILIMKEGKPIENVIDLCTHNKDIPDEIVYMVRDSLIDMGLNTKIVDSEGNIRICHDDVFGMELLSFDVAGNIQELLDALITEDIIDKKYKYLIEALSKEISNSKQSEILKHIQMKILTDMNILPLIFLREYALSKKDIYLGYDCGLQPFFIVTEKTQINN